MVSSDPGAEGWGDIQLTRLAPVIKTPPDFAPIPSFPMSPAGHVRVDQYESGVTHPCP